MGLGQRQEKLEAGLALTALEPGQRALRDPGRRGERGQRDATSRAQPLQPRPQPGEHVRDGRRDSTRTTLLVVPRNSNESCRRRPLPGTVEAWNRHVRRGCGRRRRGRPERSPGARPGKAPGRGDRRRHAAERPGSTHARLPVPRRNAAEPISWRSRGRVCGYGVELVEDGSSDRAGLHHPTRQRRARSVRGACSWRPARLTSCLTSPASASAGAETSCTARTAMGGRFAISRSVYSEPVPARSSTRSFYGSGRTTSSSSHTPTRPPRASGQRWTRETSGHRRDSSRALQSSKIGWRRWSLPTGEPFRAPPSSSGRHSTLAGTVCSPHWAARSTRDGFARVDATGRSSVPGVWVVGNATNPRAQVITAAGEGSTAAIAINADLVEEDVRNACKRPCVRARGDGINQTNRKDLP